MVAALKKPANLPLSMANRLLAKGKRVLQSLFVKLRIYHRLKESIVYDLFWWFADRRLLQQRKSEVAFYRRVFTTFRDGDLIFDVGANRGQKTGVFLRLGARVVAVEPDETNQAILAQSFLAYRLKKCPVIIVGKAAGAASQKETMWIDEPGSAKNSLSAKWVTSLREDPSRFGKTLDFQRSKIVETTTLDELIAQYGRPYFIKIDVEGYEPLVLAGLKSTVPHISFEVNLPNFLPEGRQCVEYLSRLAPAGRFNYVKDFEEGLALPKWLEIDRFLNVLEACSEPSIEVLWKSA